MTYTYTTAVMNKLLTKAQVLVHYNTLLPIKLDADTSQYRLGGVILHVQLGGTEKTIAFGSWILSFNEQNTLRLTRKSMLLCSA